MFARLSVVRVLFVNPMSRLAWSIGAAYAAIGIVLSALPLHLRHALGASNTTVGVVMGAHALVAFVMRPVCSALAERRGYRTMLVVGTGLVAFGNAAYFMSASVPLLGVARLVTGLGDAIILTAGGAWVLAIASAERRGRTLALFGLALWAGLTVGPLIGDALAHHGGLRAAGLGGALLAIISAAIVLSLSSPDAAPAGNRNVPLFPRAVLRPGTAFVFAALGYAALASFGALHFSARGWGGGARPLVAFGIAFLLTRGLGAHLPDRFGSIPVAIGAALVEACGLLVFGVASSPLVALTGALVVGAGFALSYPAFALIAVNAVPASHRGAALGAFTSFWDIALAIGAPLAGALTTWGGGSAPFIAGAAFALLAAILAGVFATVEQPAGATQPMLEGGD